jgi:hypothetical protein
MRLEQKFKREKLSKMLPASRKRFFSVGHFRIDRRHHDSLTVASQTISEHGSHHRITIRDVGSALGGFLVQSHNDHFQEKQRSVDIFRFGQHRTTGIRLGDSFTSG